MPQHQRISVGYRGVALFLILQSPRLGATTPVLLNEMYREQQEIKVGRELFIRHCVGCHGHDAAGVGPAAGFFTQKPRNLKEGIFKFRSTPTGTLPTRDDLMRTLTKGIPHTAMPPFNFLPSPQREALITYMQNLRTDWKGQQGERVFIPSVPARLRQKETFLASAYQGQKTFLELCSLCHGDTGRGDGVGSAGLFDAANQPISPANLRARFLKSGRGARDIYRTISTGLDGTPMPSFGEALTEENRWDLVAYVLFMRGQELGMYPADFNLATKEKKK